MPFDDAKAQDVTMSEDGFCAFVTDPESRDAVANMAAGRGWSAAGIFDGGIDAALRALAKMPTPGLLIADLSGAGDPVAEINSLADVCDKGTNLIAIGEVNDVGLYRQLMAAGVGEYLVKPVDAAMLDAAIEQINEPAMEVEAPTDAAGIMAVIGARGGAGASTVAVNTAWILAHEHDLRVALVDLDVNFGSAALDLDLEPGAGLCEVLRNPERIDGLFIERAVVQESENLFVLAAEEPLAGNCGFDAGASTALLEKMRTEFDRVVVDIPRRDIAAHEAVLAQSEIISVVTDLSLIGMRDTLRLVQFAKTVAPDGRVIVVANRVGADKKAEITAADFARGLERPIDHAIPMDAKAWAASTATGKTLAAALKSGPAGVALRALAGEFGQARQAKEPSWWRRLLAK